MHWDGSQRAVLGLPAGATGTVIGAPGTGKTAVLVERAARLLGADGVAADALVVLTPSRSSATRLRDELGVRVGVATPGPLARSVGAFAFQVVRTDAVRTGRPVPQLLTGADQDRIIADLLDGDADDEADGAASAWPEHLGPAVRGSRAFRSELRVLLTELTELDVTDAEIQATGNPAWRAVSRLRRDYLTALVGMRSSHFESAELNRLAASVLRRGEPITGLEGLTHVLIDDAQELTRGALDLVAALRERGAAVLAFGDPDIGSGAFRGVTPELFGDLVSLLGPTHVLDEPRRAAPPLVRLARVATQAIGAAGRVEHRRPPGEQVDDGDALAAVVAPSPLEEADRIAWALRSWHLDGGTPWRRMAVIAHDMRQLAALEDELAAREVPVRAVGVQRPLGQERSVRELLEVVRLGLLAPSERDAQQLADALLTPFGGLDAVGMRRLRARLRHRELADGGALPARELLREALATPTGFALLDLPEAAAAGRFAQTLHRLHTEAATGATIHELLWIAWDAARAPDGRRLRVVWRQEAQASGSPGAEAARALDGLVALFDAAKRFVERSPGNEPAVFVRRMLDSDVPEDVLQHGDGGGTVALLTPAAALGAEFDAVVIAGVQDGVWPNLRLRGGLLDTWLFADTIIAARSGSPVPDQPRAADRRRAALSDELRLFVRAITRARHRLLVTAVDDDDQTPSSLLSLLPAPLPPDDRHAHPLTLRGLVARHRRTLTAQTATPAARDDAAGQLAVLAREGVPGAAPADWYGVRPVSTAAPLVDLDARSVSVSPSRMDVFETCELDWAVRALGGDTRTSPTAGIGTILHAAMEAAPDGDLAAMQRVLDDRWGELDFEAPWIGQKERARAEEYLRRTQAYLREITADGGRTIASEAAFRLAIPLDGSGDVLAVDDAAGEQHGTATADAGRAIVSGIIDQVVAYPPGRGDHPPARGRTWQPMPDDGGAHIVIADLKTGRSEARVKDNDVTDDAQLAFYQLAVLTGLVSGADPAALGGARLVVVSQTLARSPFRIAHQQPLDDERRREFLDRVTTAARGMSAARFTAHLDAHCLSSQHRTLCRPHVVKAVSAS